MSAPDHHQTTLIEAPLSVLLGLREGGDPAEWGRIRAALLDSARDWIWFLLAANIVGAGMTGLLVLPDVSFWIVAVWGTIVSVASTMVVGRRAATHHRDGGFARLEELRDTARESVMMALAWAAVPLCFHPSSTGAAAGIGVIIAILMTAVVIALAPLALATIMFLVILGTSVAGSLIFSGLYAAAAGSILFTSLLLITCLNRVRGVVLLRAAQIALHERDQTVSLLLREFEDTGADWLWETDAARRVVKASPRFAHACGLDRVAIENLPFLRVLAGSAWNSGQFSEGLRKLAAKMKARESFTDLRLPVVIEGKEHWWELAASPRYDADGSFLGFRGVGSDVTEQRASSAKIHRMARIDTLTGLPNRLTINEKIEEAMAEAEKWNGRCAFLIIDLDRFKAVNDTLGHPIGDRLLTRVSERLAQTMSEGSICGRLGGDEFAVVLHNIDNVGAVESLALRIIEICRGPMRLINIPCGSGRALVWQSVRATVKRRTRWSVPPIWRFTGQRMRAAEPFTLTSRSFMPMRRNGAFLSSHSVPRLKTARCTSPINPWWMPRPVVSPGLKRCSAGQARNSAMSPRPSSSRSPKKHG